MFNFVYKSPIFAGLMYVLALGIAATYILFKRRQGRLLTICNINIYQKFFVYFLITPFQFQDVAWLAFGRTRAAPFYPYLYQSVGLNLMSLSILLITEMHWERKLKSRNKQFFGERFCNTVNRISLYQINLLIFYAVAASWLALVLRYNGTLPLFNSGRSFFYDEGMISYIYQGLTGLINIYGIYFGLYLLSYRKGLVALLVASILSIGTGNRGDFIIGMACPILVVAFYKHNKTFNFRKLLKFVPMLGVFVGFGLYLGIVRSGKSANVTSLITSLLYGNTFSDLRDGAYIFYGHENNLGGELAYGRTFLAGLLTFVPSYLSPFRREWTWGRYSTYTIFGMTNHFGLRGGDAVESFLNFGLAGLIVSAVVRGYLLANMERLSEKHIYDRIQARQKINTGALFYLELMQALWGFFSVSTSIRDAYILVLLILLIMFFYCIHPSYRARH